MNYKKINFNKEEIYNFLINSKNKKEFVNKIGYKDSRSAQKICERFGLNLNDLGKQVGKLGESLKNGDKFGKLTIIDANCIMLGNKKKETGSLCQCDCGEQIYVKNDFLKRGHTKSCGCSSGHNKKNQIKDGDIFGELIVIKANIGLNAHNDQTSLCKCSCGKEFTIINNALRRGQYSCGHVHSRGETKIQKILSENNIPNQSQYTFSDLKGKRNVLRFDFAIFDEENKIKALIEYQGIIHYKENELMGKEGLLSRKESDQKKRDYCKKNNLKLIEIPYTDYNKIDLSYLKKLIYNE